MEFLNIECVFLKTYILQTYTKTAVHICKHYLILSLHALAVPTTVHTCTPTVTCSIHFRPFNISFITSLMVTI